MNNHGGRHDFGLLLEVIAVWESGSGARWRFRRRTREELKRKFREWAEEE
ncbi:MAG: hypothetical protein NUW06_02150 [Candidatus Acetothermia bacterium]|nr:hypothetical protein [Candidatus Acetothermia bacterium]MDH7504628.1 hypothetical protein [Candidatus Acetothermia bacterium]